LLLNLYIFKISGMKKLFLTLLVAGFGYLANAQPPEGDAKPGDWYGEKVTAEGAAPISDVDVCPKKGCWLKLELADGQTATVKMKDYGFFLPLAAKGKTVVINGEVKMKTTSVAELKHYAEDAKKSKEEIDAITKPEKAVSVLAKGIVVVE
jgi:hypothetical protein